MAFKKPSLPKATETELFINKASIHDYSALTLDELANEYESINQQSQMLKGRILLEARSRFKSDIEFGQWVESVGLSDTSRQTRNVYMHLAQFFGNRDMKGISLTAAYEISKPSNSDIAEEIYEYARFKNMSVSEVKGVIAKRKNETIPIPENNKPVEKVEENKHIEEIPLENKQVVTEKIENIELKEIETIATELINNQIELNLESRIMQVIENENPQVAIVALKNVIDELNKRRYGK